MDDSCQPFAEVIEAKILSTEGSARNIFLCSWFFDDLSNVLKSFLANLWWAPHLPKINHLLQTPQPQSQSAKLRKNLLCFYLEACVYVVFRTLNSLSISFIEILSLLTSNFELACETNQMGYDATFSFLNFLIFKSDKD